MAVYYKFKSAKDYESITIEGQFISAANLKAIIFESKHLGSGTDFDLMVSNAQTNEEYVDEAAMIPKYTSVLIRRVPGRPRKPIVTDREEQKVAGDKVEELPPLISMLVGDSSTMKYPEESDWDEFGNDLYAIPEVLPTQPSNSVVEVSSVREIDEENKIKALIETSALNWNHQGQDAYGGGRGFGRGMGGRMMAGRGFGQGGFERKTPPIGYICYRCKVPGHFIQHCPTNGDSNYDIRKVKPPTGIPKSMLMATPDGSYALPSGAVAVLKPNETAFEKEMEGLPSTRPVSDLPLELRCPLCKEVMKDAVFTSKCCFRSFCDKCIRDYIITKSMCACGATNILADDLLPNRTLRETISRILESSTSSTENSGSMVKDQDMESARHVRPKVPSPPLSAACKDEPMRPPPIQYSSDVKEGDAKVDDGASEGKAVNVATHYLDNKTTKNTDLSEATPESVSAKEPISPGSAPVPEETQEKLLGGEQGKKKKKKKIHLPGSAAGMQWRAYQDLGAENYAGMPLAPSAYNPYWGGGMPMGFDGYMAPFGGAMPHMGCTLYPFDVPFGGMLPQDPFAAQGYMMPVPPRDLSVLGINNIGMNQGYPMSREKSEARKADLVMKREIERLNERKHSRDSREVNSSGADGSSLKAKPSQRLMSQANRLDRADRPEKITNLDRQGPSRHSPPRPLKRRSSSDHDRLCGRSGRLLSHQLPGVGRERRKQQEEEDVVVVSVPNGRDEPPAAHRSSAATSNGYKRRRSSYEHESSDEEEREYHFKRRPSSSSSSLRDCWQERLETKRR